VLFKEMFETTLKRVVFAKTNLKVELYYHSLKDSLVGIYDDPERGQREHVVSIAFLCRIVSRESKPGAKVDTVESFSKAEVKDLEIAFDHRKTVEDAFTMIKELR
jgi:8-oxo-dGTP diphosphatase